MASVKIASLLIRTLAKPISNKIKQQAQEHPRFRELCIGFAQWNYRTEYRLRTGLLGESPKAVKPLSEAKAVANGATTIAEGFLFAVALAIILGESLRSSRSAGKRRDAVDDSIEELTEQVKGLVTQVEVMQKRVDEQLEDVGARQDEITRILDRIVYIGLRGGWSELPEVRLGIPEASEPSDDMLSGSHPSTPSLGGHATTNNTSESVSLST